MQYKEGKYLTEHKTAKVMSSKPLNRAKSGHKSFMQLANEQSPIRVITRRNSGDDSVFMGC